jgi:hypothetical protein
MFRIIAVLALCIVTLIGCGAGEEEQQAGSPEPPPDSGQQQYAQYEGGMMQPEIPDDAARAGGLEWASAADEVAAEWQQDAALYAIATISPVDGAGTAQGWLYTYVSESAESVASVAVVGGEAELEEQSVQQIPLPDIENLLENALPERDALRDSPEAMRESREVGPFLEENPGADAAAGLDSFSGEGPAWILSTTDGQERIEEQIPAGA